jgi:hypothetical protein
MRAPKKRSRKPFLLLLALPATLLMVVGVQAATLKNPNDGGSGIGIQGKKTQPPPTQGATISLPPSGTAFTTLPITVTGICPQDLLVKLYKNGVFTGSQQCENGSFSIQTDLFNGQNDFVARVYDGLDQPGPDSNTVTYIYNTPAVSTVAPRVALNSNFASRGADPAAVAAPVILARPALSVAPHAPARQDGPATGVPLEFCPGL